MQLKVELLNFKEIKAKFESIKKAMADLRPAFNEIKDEVVKIHVQNIDTRGKTFKSPWPKRKALYPWPLMNKTGKLRSSFNGKVTKMKLEVTNKVPYARYHHLGMGRLPERKLGGMNRDIEILVTDAITAHILKQFK